MVLLREESGKVETKETQVLLCCLKSSGTKMESQLWCHLVKIPTEEKDVWSCCVESVPKVSKAAVTLTRGESGSRCFFGKKQHQKVWSTLSKVHENLFNPGRAIIDEFQEGEECATHLGKLSTPWSELKMCGQLSMNIDVLCGERKQGKRDNLSLEEVWIQVQKEEESHELLVAKESLTSTSVPEASVQPTKEAYKKVERGDPRVEHSKKCWTVNPSLKSAKSK